MADITNFVSLRTEDFSDFNTVFNAAQVSVVTTPLPEGDWSHVTRLQPHATAPGGLSWDLLASNHSQPTSDHIIFGFRKRFGDISPAAEYAFWNSDAVELYLEADGDIRLEVAGSTVATATSPLTVDTYHTFEIRILPNTTTGEVQVWVDDIDIFGANQTSLNTESYSNYTDSFHSAASSAASGDVFLAGAYHMINSTSDEDRLGSTWEIIGPYQDTAITGATPDNGDDLDAAGTDWATVNEIPFSDESTPNLAGYAAKSALSGSIHYDGGTRLGPSGDDRIDGTPNIKAWKGLWRVERSNGSGTTHTLYMGDDGATFPSGFDSVAPTIGTSPTNFNLVTDVATNMPTIEDNFSLGFGKSSGGRDILCHEMVASILHLPHKPRLSLLGAGHGRHRGL